MGYTMTPGGTANVAIGTGQPAAVEFGLGGSWETVPGGLYFREEK